MKVTSQTKKQKPNKETDKRIIDILSRIYVFGFSDNLATTFADMSASSHNEKLYETRTEDYLIRFTFCELDGGGTALCDMTIRGVSSHTIELDYEFDLPFTDFISDAVVALIKHAGYKFDEEVNRNNYVSAIHAIARKYFVSERFIVQMV